MERSGPKQVRTTDRIEMPQPSTSEGRWVPLPWGDQARAHQTCTDDRVLVSAGTSDRFSRSGRARS